MKFFSKLRKDTNGDDSTSGGTSISINDSLDYFSQHGQLGKMIVANQRQVVNSMGDRIQSLSSLDIDLEMNKEMIKETALLKYGTSEQDLSLMDTAWFPRFKNKLRNKKGKTRNDVDEGDNESIISYGSVRLCHTYSDHNMQVVYECARPTNLFENYYQDLFKPQT